MAIRPNPLASLPPARIFPCMVADRTTPTAHSPFPTAPLSPLDSTILTLFYTLPDDSLEALLKSLADKSIENAPTTLFELTQWAQADHIQPWIETRRGQLREAEQREMVALLKTIATTSSNQVEQRRAISLILRASKGPTRTPRPHSSFLPRTTPVPRTAPVSFTCSPVHPLTCSDPATRSPPPTPHSPLPSPHSPNPTRSPQDLIDLILLAIREPDNPEPTTGPLTLFTLAGRTNPADLPNYSSNYLANVLPNCWQFRHASQHPLTLRTAAQLHAAHPNLSTLYDSATALIDLILHDHSTRTLQVELRRPQSGPHKDCWLLQHLSAFTHASTDPLHNTS